MSNKNIRDFVNNITSWEGPQGDIKGQLNSIVTEKAIDMVEIKRVEVAKNFFGFVSEEKKKLTEEPSPPEKIDANPKPVGEGIASTIGGHIASGAADAIVGAAIGYGAGRLSKAISDRKKLKTEAIVGLSPMGKVALASGAAQAVGALTAYGIDKYIDYRLTKRALRKHDEKKKKKKK